MSEVFRAHSYTPKPREPKNPDKCPDCGRKMNMVRTGKLAALPIRYVCKCGKMVYA
jgi:hypothetical protein